MKLFRYDIGNTKNKQMVSACFFTNIMQQKMRIITWIDQLKNTQKTIRLLAVYAMLAYVFLDGVKESRSFDPLRQTKIGLKTRVVRRIRSKITVFDGGERNEFEKSRFHFAFSLSKLLSLHRMLHVHLSCNGYHAFNLFFT